jgi:hypothetical protein
MSKQTRTQYMYSSRNPYSSTQKGIREGQIPVYLIDGQVMIESDEADGYHAKKKAARLAKLVPHQKLFA